MGRLGGCGDEEKGIGLSIPLNISRIVLAWSAPVGTVFVPPHVPMSTYMAESASATPYFLHKIST